MTVPLLAWQDAWWQTCLFTLIRHRVLDTVYGRIERRRARRWFATLPKGGDA